MCVFNPILGDQITTSTTETDLDGDKENFRKRLRAAASNEILDRKRRCRKKYLHLNGVTAVRQFQCQAQIELSMHQEHLYEFLRFIRHSSSFFESIQKIGQKFMEEDVMVQIKELVKELIKIRRNSNFVNVGYESK
ncbi:unnamed protein product [Rotaria magnacalcarata]